MKIRDRKEFCFPVVEPFFSFVALAFWTVTVSATVVTDT
jgi:hypothetical protein